jgi:hypothetical protein
VNLPTPDIDRQPRRQVNGRRPQRDAESDFFPFTTRVRGRIRVTINLLTHPRSAPVEIPSGPRVPPPGAGASPFLFDAFASSHGPYLSRGRAPGPPRCELLTLGERGDVWGDQRPGLGWVGGAAWRNWCGVFYWGNDLGLSPRCDVWVRM